MTKAPVPYAIIICHHDARALPSAAQRPVAPTNLSFHTGAHENHILLARMGKLPVQNRQARRPGAHAGDSKQTACCILVPQDYSSVYFAAESENGARLFAEPRGRLLQARDVIV